MLNFNKKKGLLKHQTNHATFKTQHKNISAEGSY